MHSALLLLALALPSVAAAEAVGLWATEEDKSHIEIYRCGDRLCGKIAFLGEPLDEETGLPRVDGENPDPSLRERPILGIEILEIPATADKKGVWRKGRIYDPESGNTYKCQMWLEEGGQILKLKGYIGVPVLGRKTTWRRLNDG